MIILIIGWMYISAVAQGALTYLTIYRLGRFVEVDTYLRTMQPRSFRLFTTFFNAPSHMHGGHFWMMGCFFSAVAIVCFCIVYCIFDWFWTWWYGKSIKQTLMDLFIDDIEKWNDKDKDDYYAEKSLENPDIIIIGSVRRGGLDRAYWYRGKVLSSDEALRVGWKFPWPPWPKNPGPIRNNLDQFNTFVTVILEKLHTFTSKPISTIKVVKEKLNNFSSTSTNKSVLLKEKLNTLPHNSMVPELNMVKEKLNSLPNNMVKERLNSLPNNMVPEVIIPKEKLKDLPLNTMDKVINVKEKNVMESLISAKNSLNSTVKIPKNNINSTYKGINDAFKDKIIDTKLNQLSEIVINDNLCQQVSSIKTGNLSMVITDTLPKVVEFIISNS